METHPPEMPPELPTRRPFNNAISTLIFAGLFLFLQRLSSRVRINDEDWVWLDPIRIRERRWLLDYLGVSLVEALAIGAGVGLAHWLSLRLVRRAWIKEVVGWVFFVAGAVLSFWLVRFFHYLPRVWIEPRQPW
jgi:hypothetical protein